MEIWEQCNNVKNRPFQLRGNKVVNSIEKQEIYPAKRIVIPSIVLLTVHVWKTQAPFHSEDFGLKLRVKSCLGPPRGPSQHCSLFKDVIALHDLLWTGTRKEINIYVFARSKDHCSKINILSAASNAKPESVCASILPPPETKPKMKLRPETIWSLPISSAHQRTAGGIQMW